MINLQNAVCRSVRRGYILFVLVALTSICSSCGAKARASRSSFSSDDAVAVYDANGKLLAHPDCPAYAVHEVAPTGDLVQDLITLGRKFLGKPYRYRGSLPWAMDCSGYVRYLALVMLP